MDLLTFTSYKNLGFDREKLIDKLFPTSVSNEGRPYIAKKPTIFLSARVHPGEVPSSHVMNGIIDFLSNEDDHCAMALLNYFVVKIIPILNPDGVARGHYRLDTMGNNLNRFYENPCPE